MAVEEETPSPRDPRFDEMLELVLLTLRFPFRLGLPGYYRLSGRFVMTPEAAILVLSAAHYRRGMTVVAFIFFLLPSLCPSLARPLTLSFFFSLLRPNGECFRGKSCNARCGNFSSVISRIFMVSVHSCRMCIHEMLVHV